MDTPGQQISSGARDLAKEKYTVDQDEVIATFILYVSGVGKSPSMTTTLLRNENYDTTVEINYSMFIRV